MECKGSAPVSKGPDNRFAPLQKGFGYTQIAIIVRLKGVTKSFTMVFFGVVEHFADRDDTIIF